MLLAAPAHGKPEKKNRSGTLEADTGTRDTSKRIAGLDLSGSVGVQTHWFVQLL